MAAATRDEVAVKLAAMMHKNAGPDELAPFLTPIIDDNTAEAEAWLRGKLTRMGFPATEVAAWPEFRHVHKRQALYLCGRDDRALFSETVAAELDGMNQEAFVSSLKTLGGTTAATTGRSAVGELKAGMFARPFVGCGGLPAGPFAAE
jgi:hypothetical protein